MKILLADRLPDFVEEELQALNFDVISSPNLSADDLPEAVGGVQVLVVRSTRVTAETIEAADSLQLVIRAGAGTNTIDCAAAAGRAIHVANCPGKNAVAVAELTLGLILSLDRNIPDNVMSMRGGRWEKKKYGKSKGLFGQTIGILGMGRIGAEVASRAQAFGMECIAWSRSLSDERAQELGVTRCDSVGDVCEHADVVVVHLAYSEDTRHIVGESEIKRMKPGAMLVHMARGGVVDDKAMLSAVREGRIRAAADVFEEEPKGGSADYEGPFKDADGFYGTHHIAASTEQAQSAVASEVVRIVAQWLETGTVANCVNRSGRSPAKGQIIVRHLDRIGVLASVLDVLKSDNISVKEMRNTIFDETGAASATIKLDQEPSEGLLERINTGSDDILGVVWLPFD